MVSNIILVFCNTHAYCSLVFVMSHKSSPFIHLPNTHYFVILLAPQVHHTHTTPPRGHGTHTTLQRTNFPTPTSYFLSHRDYTTYIVSQAVIGYPFITIFYMTPDHSYPSSNRALTYRGPSTPT